jgi:antibiotic biosynthesis monooxygenase (ABM) superfamily enzyme
MYPHVLQYETHQREMQIELAKLRHREEHSTPRPSRPRMALLTWVGAYSMITLILYLLGPFIAEWPLLARTAVLSGLMVVTLTWAVLPTLTRLFHGWLAT